MKIIFKTWILPALILTPLLSFGVGTSQNAVNPSYFDDLRGQGLESARNRTSLDPDIRATQLQADAQALRNGPGHATREAAANALRAREQEAAKMAEIKARRAGINHISQRGFAAPNKLAAVAGVLSLVTLAVNKANAGGNTVKMTTSAPAKLNDNSSTTKQAVTSGAASIPYLEAVK